MGNLISEALSMGWMALAILVGLLVYFQVSIPDPTAKKRAVFKTFIGIVSTFLLFVAIANYKTNFYGESRRSCLSLSRNVRKSPLKKERGFFKLR